MTIDALTVPLGISRRIEKLAAAAGRKPDEMLKFVLRDGLEHTEYAVREANAGLAELDAGRGVPLVDVRRRIAARLSRRAA